MNDYIFSFYASGIMGVVGAYSYRGTLQQAVDLYRSFLAHGVSLTSGWLPPRLVINPGAFNVQVQVNNSQTGQVDDAAQKAFLTEIGVMIL